MTISTIKKILLTGTALVAVAAFGAQAQAAVVPVTTGLPGTWAALGTQAQDGNVNTAVNGDTIAQGVGSTFLLTITNNGTANDGSANTNTFAPGAIAGTSGGFTTVNGSANDLTVTIASAAYSAAAPITVSNTGFVANGNATSITGALSTVGGVTTITNGSTAVAKTVSLSVGGAASLGAVNITAGTFAGANATLSLANATNTLGAVTLTEAGSGTAALTISSTGAQTITSINGNAAGKGTLNLTGNGSSISGTIGNTFALAAVNAGGNGNTNTLSGLTNATALNVTGTGTVNVNGAGTNTIGTVAFGANNGTVSLGAGANLTGNVTMTGGVGTLTLAGASAITGNVGTSTTNKLLALNLGAGAASISGDVYATTITANGNNTIGFGGNVNATTLAFAGTSGTTTIASGKNLSATVTGGAGANTLTFAGGTQTMTGTITDTSMILNAGAAAGTTTFANNISVNNIATGAGTTTFNGTVTAAGTLTTTAAGTTTFNTGTSTITGALTNAGRLALGYTSLSAAVNQPIVNVGTTVATDGAYTFGVTTTSASGTMTTGKLVATGGALSLSNAASTIAVNVDPAAGFIADKSVSLIADGTAIVAKSFNGASDATLHAVTSDNSALYDFQYVRGDYATAGDILTNLTAATADNTQIYLVANRNAITSLGSTITSNDASVNTALTSIGAGGNADIDTFQGAVASAATAAEVHNLLQSVTPTVDGSAQAAALSVGTQVSAVADNRLLAMRDGDTSGGVAAGATANGTSMWFQGYGQHAEQDLRDGVNGYDSDTWGGVIGADSTALLDRAIVGLAFNYGNTSADSNNVNTTATDVDTYGLTLYGNYDLGDKMDLDGQVGYAYNEIDTARHNVGGVPGQTASGSTDSNQWIAKVGVSRGYALDGGLTLTPNVSAAYTYLDTQGYTETGAGGLNQVVGSDSLSALDLGIGGTLSWKIQDADDNVFVPALHAGYSYDAIGDNVQTTSSFAGAPGTSFVTNGASPDRNTFDVGAKLLYSTKANWDLSATYDYQFKEDYTAHTGQVRVTAHF